MSDVSPLDRQPINIASAPYLRAARSMRHQDRHGSGGLPVGSALAGSRVIPESEADSRSWPRMVYDGLEWAAAGACAGRNDVSEGFTRDGKPRLEEARELAREFCVRCPVIADCAADADLYHHPGLWGGSWRSRKDCGGRNYRLVPLIPGAPPHTPNSNGEAA